MEQTVETSEPLRNPLIAQAGIKTRITPANARIMQQKAYEARMLRLHPPQPEPQPEDNAASKLQGRVQEIDNQIDTIFADMCKAKEPRDKQALAMALDRLYGIWSLLTGHPRPGVRKEVKGRSKVTYAQPQDQ